MGQKRLELIIFYQASQNEKAGKSLMVVCGGIRIGAHVNGIAGIGQVSVYVFNTGFIYRSGIVGGTVISV